MRKAHDVRHPGFFAGMFIGIAFGTVGTMLLMSFYGVLFWLFGVR